MNNCMEQVLNLSHSTQPKRCAISYSETAWLEKTKTQGQWESVQQHRDSERGGGGEGGRGRNYSGFDLAGPIVRDHMQ